MAAALANRDVHELCVDEAVIARSAQASTCAVGTLDEDAVASAIEPILTWTRKTCADEGLDLVAAVTRTAPHAVALIFEFSNAERRSDALQNGNALQVRLKAQMRMRRLAAECRVEVAVAVEFAHRNVGLFELHSRRLAK